MKEFNEMMIGLIIVTAILFFVNIIQLKLLNVPSECATLNLTIILTAMVSIIFCKLRGLSEKIDKIQSVA